MLRVEGLGSFVDRTAEDTLPQRRIAGVSISVAHQGMLLYADGHGYANLIEGTKATASTVYSLGSMTKQFTAVAVLQLVERGRIALDASIGSALPLKKPSRSAVPIRHLLSHTAGIRADVELAMLADSRGPNAMSRDAALSLFTDDVFDAGPGEVWRYSNFGYYLLGLLIEEIAGMSYSDYLKTEILHPAGLTNTTCGAESVPMGLLAQGYAERQGEFASVDTPATSQTFSSGALFSNVLDLQMWRAAIEDGRLIQTSTYRQMTSPAVLLNGEATSYGLGLFLGACGPFREIGHDGTSGGFSGQAAYYPDVDLSVVVLMNSERHEAERLEKMISRRVLGVSEPTAQNQKMIVSEGELVKYTGIYLHKGLELPVETQESGLVIVIPNRRILPLTYQGNNMFVEADDPSIQIEFMVQSARADGFVVSREGKTIANARRLSGS